MRVYKYENAAGEMVVGDDDRKIRIEDLSWPGSAGFVHSALYGQFSIIETLYDFYGFDYETARGIADWAITAHEGAEKRISRNGNHGVYDLHISIFCDGEFNDPRTEKLMK